ncbi:hypothetical protein [Jeotgalibaca sp. A127]|uniref:hypothetical protein n=1 Tax=Jeotgalibaca sp. A127 TaxID=3457324 RepID=UPI003FD4BA01
MADFNITAIIGANVKEFQNGMAEAKKALGDFTSKSSKSLSSFLSESSDTMSQVGENFIGAGKAMSAAITAPAIAGVTAAVKSYADLEQIVGGIEKLFGDSADAVIKNSESAYRRAGVSGVDYMEQVTSFSATLLAGLDGDTVKAAEYADKAIVDMADNANTFGTSIGDIQNAYQGFSKDNYTMLDNLKLGFGGTAGEMARLVNESGVMGDSFEATAENVKEIPFDQLIEAIHVTQENMGITGTTAKEASETVSGSFDTMVAAAQNLVAGLGDSNADVEVMFQVLGETVETFASNVKRVLETIWDNLPFEDWQKQLGLAVVAAGPFIAVVGVIAKVVGVVLGVFSAVAGAFAAFSGAIATGATGFAALKAGFAALMGPVGWVTLAIVALIAAGIWLWKNWDEVKAKALELKDKLIEAWGNIKEGVATFVEETKAKFLEWIETTKQNLIDGWNNIKESVATAIENMKTAIVEKFEAIKQGISDKWTEIKEAITTKLTEIGTSIAEFFEPLTTLISTAWDGIKTTTELVWESIKAFFAALLLTIVGLFTGDLDLVKEAISKAWDIIKENTSTIWNNIKDNLIQIWENIKMAVAEKIEELKTNVTNKFNEVKANVETAVANLRDNVLAWFERVKTEVPQKIETMKTNAVNKFNEMKDEAIAKAIQLKDDVIAKITEMIDSVGTWISELPAKVKQGFEDAITEAKSFGEQAVQAGRDLIAGFVSGVTEKAKGLVDAVGGAIGGSIDWAKNLLGINSPSKLFKQFGLWTDEGFIEGIKTGATGVKNSMGDMVGGAITQAESMTGQLNNALAASVSGGYAMTANGQLTINQQPAYITLNLGNQAYSGFVDDISNKQNASVQLDLAYL